MAGGVYHVYARGNRREPIFVEDEDRRDYLSMFGEVALDLQWRPLAYCLMTNHVHHLVELTEPNLSIGIRQVHSLYAKAFNQRHSTGGGHLFEKRFGSTRAKTHGAVMYIASYVLLNPVRANLCATPEQYPWCSYGVTLRVGSEPPWLDVPRLLEYFGGAAALIQVVDAVRVLGAAGFEPATSRV